MEEKSTIELSYLALGDSYTIGECVEESERWSVQLVHKLMALGKAVSLPKIIARTGWTTDELKTAIVSENITQTFDLVSLLIGVNNQYRGLSVEQFRTEFVELLAMAIHFADNKPSQVFVVSIPDWGVTTFGGGGSKPEISTQIDLFNEVVKDESEKKNITFVDITPISRQALNDSSLIANDNLHPSGKMYELWAEKIVMTIIEEYHQKALLFDQNDLLASFRNQFFESDEIYLDGNSLGKLPKRTIELTSNLIQNQWRNGLIRSWNEHWIDLPHKIATKIAKLVGARADEIFVGDNTSINFYKLAFATLRLNPTKTKIITDSLNFPSDLYVLQGLLAQQFQNHSLKIIQSTDELSISEEAIEQELDENTAFLTLSHVVYKSAFMHNMKKINELAHRKGTFVIWDLSHSAGAVAVNLNESNADMAVGCTYKYLNGGPGAPAFLYVRKDLQEKLQNPISAWFSHQKPFDFDLQYEPKNNIQRFATGTPSILSLAATEAGIDLINEAGIENLREKSMQQSSFLVELVQEFLLPIGFTIASPLNVNQRGSHISIQHLEGYRINRAMIEPLEGAKSIIPDFRPPNNIRLGIAPLYNTFLELYQTVLRIKQIVEDKEFERFGEEKLEVT